MSHKAYLISCEKDEFINLVISFINYQLKKLNPGIYCILKGKVQCFLAPKADNHLLFNITNLSVLLILNN